MSATALDMSMSLDGFITGQEDDHDNGLGLNGHRLHDWLSDGADPASHRPSGVSGEVFDELMAAGAVVVGRRTFELGARARPNRRRPRRHPPPLPRPPLNAHHLPLLRAAGGPRVPRPERA
jgi:dihydrofolate reductase